jgi:glucose-1-phosphate thymidylyltransferase
VDIVGVIPAAGHATRLQPLAGSKEVLHVRGRPVIDYIVARMRAGGCSRLRVVTRAQKEDVIAHAQDLGAEVVLASPKSVSESVLAGMDGLSDLDIVLIGFPDTLWEPETGFRPLVRAVAEGCDVALGLFRITPADLARSDVVVFDDEGRIIGVDVKPAKPRSEWIWGCAVGRTRTWAGLHKTDWPGGYIDLLCREGRGVRGFKFSDAWLDIGTRDGLQRADADVIGWSANR